MQKSSIKRDVFALVTNQIIDHLEKGTVPWKQPWTKKGLPRNLVTRKSYRGINVWLLNSLNYEENMFLTYNQVRDLGGKVRKGEKAHLVVFWKWIDKKSEQSTEKDTSKKIPLLRYFQVFNIAQCIDIPQRHLPVIITNPNNPIEICEAIVESMPNAPVIRHMGDEAYYQPFFDLVNMPSIARFVNSETYYSTLFHELIHSTGHKSRLNRKEIQTDVTNRADAYSLEELTAEIGACYLNSFAGIGGLDFANHIAYIQGWLKRLHDDKRLIVYASAQAQRAADYILNLKPTNTEEGTTEDMVLKTIGV